MNMKVLDHLIETGLDIVLITVSISLIFITYGVWLQKRILKKEVKSVIGYILRPLLVWGDELTKQQVLTELNSTPRPGHDRVTAAKNRRIKLGIYLFALVSVVVAIAVLIASFFFKADTFTITWHVVVLIVVVLAIEVMFYGLFVAMYRPIEIDKVYALLISRVQTLEDQVGGSLNVSFQGQDVANAWGLLPPGMIPPEPVEESSIPSEPVEESFVAPYGIRSYTAHRL
jgi:hypothetical protein